MKQPDFIHATNLPDTTKMSTKQLLRLEMEKDESVFSKKVRELLKRRNDPKQKLSDNENTLINEERNVWWFDKYGFPYSDEIARGELLRLKYSPPNEIFKAQNLQKELFENVKLQDQVKIDQLRIAYEKAYPDQQEGVSVLFELNTFFKDNQFIETTRLSTEKEILKKRSRVFEDLTQYQFLLSHFISQNMGDKEFMNKFWAATEMMAESTGNLIELNKLRKSALSQVATLEACKRPGITPKISHPKEDAFHAIDMWAGDEPIQLKGTPKNYEFDMLDVNSVSFPAIQINADDTTHLIDTSWLGTNLSKFRVKLDRYSRMVGRNLRGHLLILPYSKFDPVTGEPTEEFVMFMKEKLRLGKK